MKNISLLEVSALVFAVAVCSITVQANEDPKEKAALDKAKAQMEEKPVKAGHMVSHDKLFAPLDIDSNGVISEQELSMSKNKLLKEQFKKIDRNEDKGISEEELKSFLAKVDVKKNF
ncbi:hypothetical protein [Thalassotalea euphylliae]|uniref:EF-hand domain-containing protein n=1 Tax=Thalassotalea euphylliae TaxID=1655234 RepID=A0A3E0UBJ9_9GAMM|nr:hypothetical protein [Thalassotalea euphylliae]REL34388.1 hypothetical protein DXX92_02930 [Thalassotalea euphylliae]